MVDKRNRVGGFHTIQKALLKSVYMYNYGEIIIEPQNLFSVSLVIAHLDKLKTYSKSEINRENKLKDEESKTIAIF